METWASLVRGPHLRLHLVSEQGHECVSPPSNIAAEQRARRPPRRPRLCADVAV